MNETSHTTATTCIWNCSPNRWEMCIKLLTYVCMKLKKQLMCEISLFGNNEISEPDYPNRSDNIIVYTHLHTWVAQPWQAQDSVPWQAPITHASTFATRAPSVQANRRHQLLDVNFSLVCTLVLATHGTVAQAHSHSHDRHKIGYHGSLQSHTQARLTLEHHLCRQIDAINYLMSTSA